MRIRGPFPGMDPWLERYWGDMHNRIVLYSFDQIEAQLPEGLIAMVESTVYVLDGEFETRRISRPNVAIIQNRSENPLNVMEENGEIAVAEPLKIVIADEPYTETHIEIREGKDSNRLVTAIEVLSPANKLDAEGRSAYRKKRRDYYDGGVNFIELDLLRAGAHLVAVPLSALGAEVLAPYKCMVRRAGEPGVSTIDYYALRLRRRLSKIRVPLRAGDGNVFLDLQAPIDEAYRRGRYAARIDYTEPPIPPLEPDDAAWAAQVIAAIK